MKISKGWLLSPILLTGVACLVQSVCAGATCDLSAAKGSIQQTTDFFISGGKVCATFYNSSSACTFPVAVETFSINSRMFSLEAQTFVDSSVVNLAHGQSATLCAAVSSCATQVDSYTGPQGDTIFPAKNLTTADPTVGGRLIQGLLLGCFCAPAVTGPGCTLTQGYYKNHLAAIPASLQLGTITYSQQQLQTILQTPVQGNCLISLAHQLITAEINISSHQAAASGGVLGAISTANSLLGSNNLITGTNSVSCSLDARFGTTIDTLTNFNEGRLGSPSCPEN